MKITFLSDETIKKTLEECGFNFEFHELSSYPSYPIIVTTQKRQKKTSNISWINKLYERLYGYEDYDCQEKGKILLVDGKIYCTQEDFDKMKEKLGHVFL